MATFNPKTVEELVNAINTANVNNENDTIVLQPKTVYEVTTLNTLDADNHGASGLPVITSNITIVGNGATLKRVATAPFRIFRIMSGSTVVLRRLVISQGSLLGLPNAAGLHGAGIRNEGTLTLEYCTLENNTNQMTSGYGGAIFNGQFGVLTVKNSRILNNQADQGAGIENYHGILMVDNSVIAHNNGQQVAGVGGFGTATITNTRISNNQAQDAGALRWEEGDLTVTYCDIVDNVARNSGACIYVAQATTQNVILNHNRIFNNRSLDTSYLDRDVYKEPYAVINACYNWWGAANGPSGDDESGNLRSGQGDSVGRYVAVAPWATSAECAHEAVCDCHINYAADDCFTSDNPISLRLGEKRIVATDLSVNTPAGPLTFTRTYRQNKLTDSAFRQLGRGWTHNHQVQLDDPGNPNPITMLTPKGGKVIFRFDHEASSIQYYQAMAGSLASMQVHSNSTTARYIMTAADWSIYVFDENKKLRSLTWPNNEIWTYDYYVTADGSDLEGLLKEVSDGYGRALRFTYIRETDPDTYKRGKLWRVGDHTASGLESSAPTGRYVEFGYTSEMVGGVATHTAALLTSVSDVQGHTFEYTYYGQEPLETDSLLLNYLMQRKSPEVDTDGDGITNEKLTLESLSYSSHESEIQINGDMELDRDWTDVGDLQQSGCINERVNDQQGQVEGGDYSRHVRVNVVDKGIESSSWPLTPGSHYAISACIYVMAPGGTVSMKITGNPALDQVTDCS